MERPRNIAEKFVTSADGTRVFAGAVGDPSRPALVFVHGYSLTSEVFNEIFAKPENSRDFYLVRFDMRGHGRTGKPYMAEEYSSQKHAEDYSAVVKGFSAKRPILVGWSWGGTIAGDVTSYLPQGSILGAVYISFHPYMQTAQNFLILPAFLPVWNARSDDDAAASDFPVAFNRLCFARDPNAHPSFLQDTVKSNAEGSDFVPENPAATYGIRCATTGMMSSMKSIHRKLVSEHLNDEKILGLLGEGFPILLVMGSHDSFLNCEKLVNSLKPVAKNLGVHIVEGASHAPFVDAPDEVMSAILKFAKKINKVSANFKAEY